MVCDGEGESRQRVEVGLETQVLLGMGEQNSEKAALGGH